MVEDSSINCTGDYVNVTGIGRMCGSRDIPNDIVIKEAKIEIIFRTDYQNESEGFSFLVEAIGSLFFIRSNTFYIIILKILFLYFFSRFAPRIVKDFGIFQEAIRTSVVLPKYPFDTRRPVSRFGPPNLPAKLHLFDG